MKTLLVMKMGVGSTLLGAMMFQMPATPPMKMGLWESSSSTKISGIDMPNGMTMPARVTTIKTCMTPESYAKNFTASPQQRDCVRSNEVWTGKSYSADMSCPKSHASGHVEMTFDSPESGHGTVHMTVPAGSRTMQVDMTMTNKFVSADCGAVKPDSPVIGQ